MDSEISFTLAPEDDDWEHIVSRFCDGHGDGNDGIISDSEFDRLYSHVGATISKYASYSEDAGTADFVSSRYVDQIPWISLVAAEDADPAVALRAALEAVQTAHRPVAVSFDYDPDHLLVLPPNIVRSSFGLDRLMGKG